jgi:hypothetical protein
VYLHGHRQRRDHRDRARATSAVTAAMRISARGRQRSNWQPTAPRQPPLEAPLSRKSRRESAPPRIHPGSSLSFGGEGQFHGADTP